MLAEEKSKHFSPLFLFSMFEGRGGCKASTLLNGFLHIQGKIHYQDIIMIIVA
jgi:hypothetical protein